MSKQQVLFFCTGNSAPGQMAEAFLRKYAGSIFEAHSAALEPKGVNPLAAKVMREIGINITDQETEGVEAYLGKVQFQYLITVWDVADKNSPAGWPGVLWSFEDPARLEGTEEEKLTQFRKVRDRIKKKIKSWIIEGTPV